MRYLGVRANILLNGLRIIFGSAIGLFAMPYINKTLGVNGVGKVEYVYSIINYFILFSGLGIPTYGIREVSKLKENPEKKSKLVLELTTILLITTIAAYLILFLLLYYFKILYDLKNLVVIMSTMIFFSNFGLEWFYQAIEKQLFITIRFVIFTLSSFALLIILVNSSDDYLFYAVTLVFTTVGSSITNLFFLRKHIDFTSVTFCSMEFKKHLGPLIMIFLGQFFVSMYVQLDSIILGTISGLNSVGYYAVANKLVRFITSLITIIGVMLVPKLTFLLEKNRGEYLIYLRKGFNIILIVSIPIFILIFLLSKEIIFIMAGENFFESVLVMKILSPLCVIVGVAYFLGYMVLIPQGLEKKYTFAVGLTAIFSVLLNLIFVKYFEQNATALISVSSEIFAIMIIFLFVRKDLKKINLFDDNFLKIVFATLVLAVVSYIIFLLPLNHSLRILFVTSFGLISYFVALILLREENILNEYFNLKSKLFKSD